MADGLLYVAIAGMWGAYLLPKWIARHEELSEARSVERFSRAMRVLSRRGPAPSRRSPVGGRYIVMPRRPAQPEDSPGPRVRRHRSGPVPDAVRPPEPGRVEPGRLEHSRLEHSRLEHSRPAPVTNGRTRLAARRRRLLLGLLAITATLSLVAAVTALPWWPGALAGVLVVLYVVQLRNQARQAREVARRRAQVQRRSSARQRRTESVGRVAATRQAMLEEKVSAEQAASEEQRRAAERAVRFDEERRVHEAAEQAAAQAEAAARAAKEAGWRPAPVLLPTYVTKPKAVRPTRTIDLTRPGAWSAGEAGGWESEWDDDGAASEAVDAEDEGAEEFEVEHELEHRRAVGD